MSLQTRLSSLITTIKGNYTDHDNRIVALENRTRTISNAGRAYFYSDNRWVTNSDDFYGPSIYQWNEDAGVGATPIVEFEHIGDRLRAGRRVTRLEIGGRATSAQVTDMEIYAIFRSPSTQARWSTGMDSDAEDTVTMLASGLWKSSGNETLTGDTNDIMKQSWDLDFTPTIDGYLSIYLRPVGTLTATSYFYCFYDWDYT